MIKQGILRRNTAQKSCKCTGYCRSQNQYYSKEKKKSEDLNNTYRVINKNTAQSYVVVLNSQRWRTTGKLVIILPLIGCQRHVTGFLNLILSPYEPLLIIVRINFNEIKVLKVFGFLRNLYFSSN